MPGTRCVSVASLAACINLAQTPNLLRKCANTVWRFSVVIIWDKAFVRFAGSSNSLFKCSKSEPTLSFKRLWFFQDKIENISISQLSGSGKDLEITGSRFIALNYQTSSRYLPLDRNDLTQNLAASRLFRPWSTPICSIAFSTSCAIRLASLRVNAYVIIYPQT